MANNTEKRITAKMILDSSGYNDSVKGINSSLKQVQSEFKLASEGLKSFGKDSEKLKSVQESLAKQVELHGKKVDTYKQAIEKTTTKMNDNIKERDKLKASLESANAKYSEAVKLYGKESTEAKKAKEEVEKLEKEYKNKEKAVESNAKQIQNYETNMNKAKEQMIKTQGELRNISGELDKSNNKWLNASENLKKASEKLKNVGSTVSGAGDKVLKFTAPLVAGGIASLKFATDFEDSIAKVSTIADETEVSMGDLRKQILKLSSDTGIASSEIANNVYDAISAGQKTGDAVNFVANSTKLAKAGFAEAGQSLDLLTTIMNSYGLKSKEVNNVSDILIQTQNKGKVTVAELSSSMGKVIPTANSLGVNLQQVASGYAIMTSKGIKAAETTTYMNSMLNEMGKSGTTANKAIKEASGKTFPELIKSGKTVGDILSIMNDYAKKNGKSLADMFGSAEAGKAALILSTNAGKDFNSMLGEMKNSAGSTDEAFKKVSDTTGEKFKKSLNKLKNEAIKLGDALAPMMDKGSELITKITDKLGQLDEQQLQTITKAGMAAIAFGGFLKIVGGGISTIGSIAGGLSKLTAVMGTATTATTAIGTATTTAAGVGTAGGLAGLGTAIGGAVMTFAPFIAGAAAIGLAAYGIHKHMSQEAVPAVDLFANKVQTTTNTIKTANGQIIQSYGQTTIEISKATKDAVGAYVKMDDDVTKTLSNLYVTSSKITGDNTKDLVSKYSNMTQQIKAGMDKHYNEEKQAMQTFLTNSKNITKEEQKQMLDNLKKSNEDKKKWMAILSKYKIF